MSSSPSADNRRPDPQCSEVVPPRQLDVPPVRPVEPCDPAPAPVEEKFKLPPTPPPDAEVRTVIPQPLVIGNSVQLVQCSDIPGGGPVGTPVVLPENTSTRSFYWITVPQISGAQLTYISTLAEADVAAIKVSSFSAAQITALTTLSTPQAEFVRAAVDALQVEANRQARLLGQAQIDCYWENAELTRTCPSGALITGQVTDVSITPVNPVVIPAGKHRSKVSQADADVRADLDATSNLFCWFGNEEVTVTCLDAGYEEDVPTDTELVGAATALRRGSVTIPANTVFSENTVSEATDSARLLALTQLACFYINDELVRNCQDIGAQAGTVESPASAADGITGNPVTVPQGFVTSSVSTADANQQATNLADDLLDCVWTNGEVTVVCPDTTVKDKNGNDVILPASVKSPVRTITIEAGSITSIISQADANEQAALIGRLQLNCLYCNPLILPVCIPESVANAPGLPIPVPLEWVTAAWSIDATLGMAADTICSDLPDEAISIAENVSSIPAITLGPGTTAAIPTTSSRQPVWLCLPRTSWACSRPRKVWICRPIPTPIRLPLQLPTGR